MKAVKLMNSVPRSSACCKYSHHCRALSAESVPFVCSQGEVAAEGQLGQRVVDRDLHGIDGERLQAVLLEKARELTADPPVPDRIGVGQDKGSRGFRARTASGRCSSSRSARHTSNVPSGKGSACASPTSKVMGTGKSSARRRASATITSLASSPTRRPVGPTSPAISNTLVPGPQPTSRTAAPGARALRSSMSRLLAWTARGFCASSMNRMKKSGSLVRSTCVKRLVWGWVLMAIVAASLPLAW